MEKSRTSKVLILSSGQALTALVGIASSAALTRLLTMGDFATYRQALLAMSFAVPFLILGLDQVLFAFLPGEQTRPRTVLVENLCLLFATGCVLTLVIMLGGNHILARRFNNPDLDPILRWFGLFAVLTFPTMAMSGCLLARQQTGTLAVFNVASRLVTFLAVVGFCFFWRSANAALAGMLLATAASFVVALWLMWRACPGSEWKPGCSGLRKQLAFAIPLGLGTLVGSVSLSLGQVLVSLRCSKEAFAIFTLGAMEIPLIGIITGSITSVVMVDYARYYKEGKTGEVVRLVQKAMTKSALLLLPMMMFLFCVAPALFRVLYGAQYEQAALPFRIYLLLLPVRTLTFGAVIQTTGSSKPILVNSILALIATAVLGWTLIGPFGPPGASAGSVVAIYLVSVPYLLFVLKRRLQVPIHALFPWRALQRIILASLIAFLATTLTLRGSGLNDIARLILASVVFLPTVLVSLGILGALDWRVIHARAVRIVWGVLSG